MLECPHEDVARVRRGLTTSAPIMLQQLVRRIQTAHARAGRPLHDEAAARRVSELRALMEAADWSSADGKHVLFHMLTALPWPARVGGGGGGGGGSGGGGGGGGSGVSTAPISTWLGRIFDETVLERRFRRRLADGIVRWASHWIRTFAAERWRLLAEARALEAIASP
jgi:hypothetical protein